MNSYPFTTITINNREVLIEDIQLEKEAAQSDFESSTFSFIHDWLNGATEFFQKTSGSTGPAKIICITRQQMIASAKLTEEALQLKLGYKALVCLDTRYIAGKMMLVRSFVTNMKIIAMNPVANPLKEIAANQSIDFAAFVPYQIQEILASKVASKLNEVRTIIIGGAAIDSATKENLQSFNNCQFYATYGMTETVSHIALQKLNDPHASVYFKTLPHIKIRKDDRDCLVIKANYLIDEIITNDIVRIETDTEFRWIGRYDNVINSGGVKLSPEELEIKIHEVTLVLNMKKQFFVAGVPDDTFGTKVVLFMEGCSAEEKEISEFNSMLKQSLSKYEMPREIISFEKFIYTDTGKIDRQKTMQMNE